MPKESLSTEEIEELSYYDFMGYLNVPFFNIGGLSSLDRLADACHLRKGEKVLVVGCGTGMNSLHLAKAYDCQVVGIDIAENMITMAQQNLELSDLKNQVEFRLGDAYNLDFHENTFDVVLTVFVSQFLDLPRAYPQIFRVLSPGGYLGINEMYKANGIPDEINPLVDDGEQVFRDLTDLPFTLRTPTEWRDAFTQSGFTKITIEEYQDFQSQIKGSQILKEMGGYRKFLGTLGTMMKLALKSKKIRKKYGQISKGKRVLLRNKKTSKYIGYILCAGHKP